MAVKEAAETAQNQIVGKVSFGAASLESVHDGAAKVSFDNSKFVFAQAIGI